MSPDNASAQPHVRTGQTPTKLSKEEFVRRWTQNFYDPAFEQKRAELDAIGEIAWEAYDDSRKTPRTRKAGPGFADPEHELSNRMVGCPGKNHCGTKAARFERIEDARFAHLRFTAHGPDLPERNVENIS